MALNSSRVQTPFLGGFSSPDAFHSATLYYPGQLGQLWVDGDRTYQLVQLSATGVAAATGQLLYWKDRVNKVVTNKVSEARGGLNEPAGILMNASAAVGEYIMMVVKGSGISVVSDGNGAAGDLAVAKAATNGTVTNVAAGTAPGYTVVGVITGAAANGLIPVDVNLPTLA